jgi:hypothetical protein
MRGSHHFRDLHIYDTAARAAARYALFPDVQRIPLIVLAPREQEAPDSSLSYMLARFLDWFGDGRSTYVWRDGAVSVDAMRAVLARAEREGFPVALLGTSFAFVHAEEALGSRRFALPVGSRIMPTGGFKGRSREVAPADLRRTLTGRYGIEDAFIVAEYGMTELSSQMYETSLLEAVGGRAPAPRRLWVPGWVRATIVDPESLAPKDSGDIGILRIDDAANLDSVCAVQTSDRAMADEDGIVLLGRDPDAIPRGCSLAVDELLGGPA